MFFSDDLLWTLLRGVTLSALALVWVILLVRIVGLRSFSKMTAVDFVITVAIGSLLAGAGQASSAAGLVQAVAAMGGLLAVQWAVARARHDAPGVQQVIENAPRLLMRDGVIDEAALSETRIARSDLIAKLREANVMDFSEVRAAVLETTGDVSVLHGDRLSDDLLDGVTGGVTGGVIAGGDAR